MLSINSLCLTCTNRKFCRHFYNANIESDITIEIKECNNVKPEVKSSLEIKEPKLDASYLSDPSTVLLSTKNEGFIDLKQFDTIGKVSIEHLEPEKQICSICKKEKPVTDLVQCNKCGKTVCQMCSNSYKDVDTKEIETICYECQPDTSSTEWNIKNFIKEESSNGRKNSKSSNKKSKKA